MLIIGLFAVILFQLADRDGKNGWLWSGGYVIVSILFSKLTGDSFIAIYVTFVAAIVFMIWSNPIGRK
mgnify:CR=1 FL=1